MITFSRKGGGVADRNRVSDLDPDSIRSVDLDPDSESGSGSRMTKMAHTNRKKSKNHGLKCSFED
jgi:hypothetical protein